MQQMTPYSEKDARTWSALCLLYEWSLSTALNTYRSTSA